MQQLNAANQVDEAAMAPIGSEATSAVSGESLLKQARDAIRSLNVAECNHIIEWAYENKHPAAGPALCALLRRPLTLKGKQAWRRDAWVAMRVGAIRALAVNGDPLAAPTLAHLLVHDVPDVREESRSALLTLGSDAVLPIVDTVRVASDWPLDGMMCAIDTLGQIRDKSAGPTLARVLFGLLPNVPTRWLRLHLKWSAILGAIETAFLGLFILRTSSDGGAPLILAAIAGGLLFILFSSLSALLVGIFIRNGKRNEANKVNASAANALICIKDPRSVPSLVEVATEKYSQSARSGAMDALRETLPVLTASDYGLLTGAVERRLTGMFAMHNPPLILASVRALEFVGTGQAVGPVERLARRKPLTQSLIYADIRAEAERVLPVLLERKRLEEASSVLLRPSQVAPDTGAVLLRAASSLSAYEEPAEQLLRPGQKE